MKLLSFSLLENIVFVGLVGVAVVVDTVSLDNIFIMMAGG